VPLAPLRPLRVEPRSSRLRKPLRPTSDPNVQAIPPGQVCRSLVAHPPNGWTGRETLERGSARSPRRHQSQIQGRPGGHMPGRGKGGRIAAMNSSWSLVSWRDADRNQRRARNVSGTAPEQRRRATSYTEEALPSVDLKERHPALPPRRLPLRERLNRSLRRLAEATTYGGVRHYAAVRSCFGR
jgi:hypothetical protein